MHEVDGKDYKVHKHKEFISKKYVNRVPGISETLNIFQEPWKTPEIYLRLLEEIVNDL